MTQLSDDPKNIYQRGISAGKRSCEPRMRELEKRIVEADERARNAEAGICGPCQNCSRWSRPSPTHKWGYCHTPIASIHFDNWWGEPDQKICTQENFGCVRFITKTEAAK